MKDYKKLLKGKKIKPLTIMPTPYTIPIFDLTDIKIKTKICGDLYHGVIAEPKEEYTEELLDKREIPEKYKDRNPIKMYIFINDEKNKDSYINCQFIYCVAVDKQPDDNYVPINANKLHKSSDSPEHTTDYIPKDIINNININIYVNGVDREQEALDELDYIDKLIKAFWD